MIRRDKKFNPVVHRAAGLGKSFENAIYAIVNKAWNYETGRNYVTDYLKTLDAKSTETFNHSVNVAAHVYNEMSHWKDEDGKAVFTRNEVLAYTRAALLHDVGKLSTDIDVLHSNSSLKGKKGNPDGWKLIMRHSIDGLGVAKQMGFEKEDIFISLAHHVDSTALSAGPAGGFAGATLSRGTWEEQYGEGGVEKILMENCSWVEEKDILAAKIVHFCDVVEALRSTERRYQLQHDWNISQNSDKAKNVDPVLAGRSGVRYSCLADKAEPLPENFRERNHGGAVAAILRANTSVPMDSKGDPKRYEISARELDPIFDRTPDREAILALETKELSDEEKKVLEGRVRETTDRWKSYCRQFDAIQDLNTSFLVRELVKECSMETQVEISSDKLEDIQKDPSCGVALMEEKTTKNGRKFFVLEDERLDKPVTFVPRKEEEPVNLRDFMKDNNTEMEGYEKKVKQPDFILEDLEDELSYN